MSAKIIFELHSCEFPMLILFTCIIQNINAFETEIYDEHFKMKISVCPKLICLIFVFTIVVEYLSWEIAHLLIIYISYNNNHALGTICIYI